MVVGGADLVALLMGQLQFNVRMVKPELVQQRGSNAPETVSGALTLRQLEVFWLLAQGQSNKGIARSLNIAERTVKAWLQKPVKPARLRAALMHLLARTR